MKTRKTRRMLKFIIAAFLFMMGMVLTQMPGGHAEVLAQHPTVSMPTVTGTPRGAEVTVPIDVQYVYVRSGPGQSFPTIGILVTGQTAPAVAASTGGEWIQIVYMGVPNNTGWIYARLVSLKGALVEVTAQPTPTPKVTATLDPTIAARFLVEEAATRMPTFTPAAPVVLPTYTETEVNPLPANLPLGFIIFGLVIVGAFGILLSVLRGR